MTITALPTSAASAATRAALPPAGVAHIDVIAALVVTDFDLAGCDFTADGVHSASHAFIDGVYVLHCDDCGFFA